MGQVAKSLRLNPRTTVASLLAAIPSSAVVFNELGITTERSGGKSLEEICSANGIEIEKFLRALDEIDWEDEAPRDALSIRQFQKRDQT
jgi:hypothetical protein